MRYTLLTIGLSLALFACGGPDKTDSGEGAMKSEPSTGSTGDKDEPVSNTDPNQSVGNSEGPADCSMEIALECGDGLIDGCLVTHPNDESRQLTTVHVCVEEMDNYGPDCSQEVALECMTASGKDACLMESAPSDVHVCVVE